MSPETYARVDQVHRQDMLAAAARAHQVARVRRAAPVPSTAPRPAGRARSTLRHAVAALAAAVGLVTR